MKGFALMRVRRIGEGILLSEGMQRMRTYKQHGMTSIFSHSVNVACVSVWLAARLHLRVDERAMIRGALLHDYFLYDWHVSAKEHRWHGFRHAGTALANASRDFELGDVERDVIRKHMFPLNPALPAYRETAIVCVADKLCAVQEFLAVPRLHLAAACRSLWLALTQAPCGNGGKHHGEQAL